MTSAGATAIAGLAAVPPAPQHVRLSEVIDLSYVPTREVVLEMAEWLGIDVERDGDLLWIAEKSVMAPIPLPWVPYQSSVHGDVFFVNTQTGESTWDHPSDAVYRQLYEAEKVKKTFVQVITVSLSTFADDDAVKATCTGSGGDHLTTLLCDPAWSFALLRAMVAKEIRHDIEQIRLVLPSAILPHSGDTLALHLAEPHRSR